MLFLWCVCVCDLFVVLHVGLRAHAATGARCTFGRILYELNTILFTYSRLMCSQHRLSVVKCLREVFVWGFGVLFLSCACVSMSGVLFSVDLCVCVTC